MSREDKEEQNYQHILSDERLNHEYASTYLDVDKAWDKLQKLSRQFGSEDFYNDDHTDVDIEYDAEEEYYEELDDDYYEEYEDDDEED